MQEKMGSVCYPFLFFFFFHCTAFHEMVHSTGHEKRLKRKELFSCSGFSSEMYSKEELTAEIGSACLMESVGIETEKCMKNSAAYIHSWLTALRNDKRMVVSAAVDNSHG